MEGKEADKFWKREYEQDALALTRPGSGIQSLLEGDAPCGYSHASSRAPDASPPPPQAVQNNKRPAQLAIMDRPSGSKAGKGNRKGGKGNETCRSFNSGKCKSKACRYKHVCTTCGSSSHGASECNPDRGGKKNGKKHKKNGKRQY